MKHSIAVFYNGRRQNEVTLNSLPNFNQGVLSFGRGMDNDIILPFPTVSRRHGELRFAGDKVKIADTGSLNKISVRGNVVSELELSSGTEVTLGPVHGISGAVSLRYEALDETLPPIKRISEELSGISTSVSVKERPLKTVGEQQVQRALKAHVLDRAIAGAIDYIIWFILWIGLLVVSAMVGLPLGIPLGLSSAIIVGWLYFALMEASKKQATLGKIILGLTVVDTYGNKISFLIATKRFFLKLLSTAALGLGLLPIFGGRTMHDNVSGTKVVKPL